MTIAGGLGVFTSVVDGVGMTQAQTLVAGISYTITYTVSGYSSGGVQLVLSGGVPVSGTVRSANGTYTETLVALTGNTTFGLIANASIAGGDSDPYFGNVVLLVGANGTDGSTTFVDESPAAHTLTATGNAQIDTAQFRFGVSSALFDGTGDLISAADSADWAFGAGQFTIEAWVQLATVAVSKIHTIVSQAGAGGTGKSFEFFIDPNGLYAAFSSNGTTFTQTNGPWAPAANTWYHVAVDRDASNKVRLYVDGVMKGSSTYASTLTDSTFTLSIGQLAYATPANDLNGWLDELRITKGVARYASDSGFTVPTAAFPRPALTTLNIDNVSLQAVTTYTGPLPGDMWTAARYGTRFYLANEMDPLQFIDVDSGASFADVPGSPPRAKFVSVIGDFLFLAHLRIGATDYPRDWQHSAIDDPTDWVIDGGPGSSDRQSIPSGDEITGIMPRANNGGRILQRNAKRSLIFSPGGPTAFEQRDIDPINGVFAPYSIVDIGNDDYVYIHDQGIFRGDSHTPIGLDNISRTLLSRVDYDKIEQIQGSLESTSRRALWRAQDQTGVWFMFGYDVFREKFFMTDVAATSLTNMVGVATLIDDIHGLVDNYPGILVDSPIFAGGRVAPGVWLADHCMYSLTGSPLAATIETPTFAPNPGGGAFLYGVTMAGTAPNWSIRIGSATLAETAVTWSSVSTEAARTGVAPTRVDANFHRIRLSIPSGTDWTHVHAMTPLFKPSRRLFAA